MELVNDYTLAVGQQVKKYRTHQGLTREALAAMAQLPHGAVVKLESGMGDVEGAVLYQLSVVLGVSIESLLSLAEVSDKVSYATCFEMDKSDVEKMRDAALGYFADLELVSSAS